MPVEIIDVAVPVTRYLPAMPEVKAIVRYVTRGQPNGMKQIKIPEVLAIKNAGKKLAIVHETYGDCAHAGRGGISEYDGVKDGIYSRLMMPRLGAPKGAACYFAVDTDQAQCNAQNVSAYFRAIREGFRDRHYKVGIYGPGWYCQMLKDAGLVDFTWLAAAAGWRGFRSHYAKADLVQGISMHIAGGLDVDPNIAHVADWGQFVPFSDDHTIVPPDTSLDEKLFPHGFHLFGAALGAAIALRTRRDGEKDDG